MWGGGGWLREREGVGGWEMPFKSQAQRGWMYSQHPEMAKRWESETPKGAKLPEHVQQANDAQKIADKHHPYGNKGKRK